ncbi:MAG: diacylglycerol/lipid kinase family protein [Thermodesulfobacteriota bacterium]
MSIQVIINPQAGKREGEKLFPLIKRNLKNLGLAVEIAISNQPQEALRLAFQALEKGKEIILACGGDGTIHSLLPALAYKPAILAILPLGTANDLARHWRIPLNLNLALQLLTHGQPKLVDLIVTKSGGYIGGSAGLGFDVAVIERVLSWRRYWRGIFPFLPAIMVEFLNYSLPIFSLTTDNWHYQGPAWQIILSKMNQYAWCVKIPAHVQYADGLMHMSLIPNIPKNKILPKAFLLPFGGIKCIPQAQHLSTSKISVASWPPCKYHGDGEIMGSTPETFQVLPQALRILSPP